MNRNIALLGASLTLLGGCRNSHWREHDPRADTTPIAPTNSALANQNRQDALPAMDADFLRKAGWGNQKEVQFGRVAVRQGADERVRTLGQRMIDDHSRLLTEIKTLAANKGMQNVGDQMPAGAEDDLNHLTAMSGAEFDREYVRQMVIDHEKDLDAFDREARTGVDSSVRALAARGLPVIRDHLRMVKDMELSMTAPKLGQPPRYSRPPVNPGDELPGNAPPTPDDTNPERPSSLPGTPDTPPENPRP